MWRLHVGRTLIIVRPTCTFRYSGILHMVVAFLHVNSEGKGKHTLNSKTFCCIPTKIIISHEQRRKQLTYIRFSCYSRYLYACKRIICWRVLYSVPNIVLYYLSIVYLILSLYSALKWYQISCQNAMSRQYLFIDDK